MNRIPRIFPVSLPSVLSRPRLRRGLLLLVLPVVLAACSGDDEPAFTLPPQEDLQEVTLYLSLPALSDSAAKRLGDPGTAQEETDDWDRLVLFVAYAQSQATVGPQVRAFRLTKEEYRDLPLVAGSETVHRYTLTVPAGTVRFYGLTFSFDDQSGLADKLGTDAAIAQNFPNEAAIQALSISNYYPYAAPASGSEASSKTGASKKFCSVASGYYDADGDGTPDDFTVNYSQIETDPTKIPTLTLRRLAAKIDVQWDAEAAYSEGGYVSAAVSGFEYYGSAEGRVFPELNTATSPAEGTTKWTFYNRTPISQRNGRQYHYTFPDGQTQAKVVFKVTAQKEESESATEKTYTMTYAAALRRATWYKVNATVRGNAGTATGAQGDWTITSSSN